ncbi:MAG: geranylgeranyl reductase family protein [Chloroflexi bacterium]|nr:geranylgeranyl reductase family protein [Chloroflexota bacterium]MQC26153.1 geranylgeranyl reductase family protein [Chloroflexota bacterium]
MGHLYDVAIVGAGPGGSAAAHYLAQSGMDVLLLDKSEFPRDKTCGDGLTPRALHIISDMGILDQATEAGFRINGLELHARAGNSMHVPIPNHSEYPDHMLVVPRVGLDDIIRQRAVKSGAHFESPVRVRGLQNLPDRIRIHTDLSTTFEARVAILAIGANMRLLQDLNILERPPQMILAARAYYEGMNGLNDRVEAHFAHVPLPGYGWVFPISATAANVGIGYWPSNLPWRKKSASIRVAMDNFLRNPRLAPRLEGASQQGPVKSYPLRIDFATAPTYAERILLVGETAGLVSPLTGEGIDFALESGQIAAEFLVETFARGEFTRSAFAAYDSILRRNFQSIFRFLGLARRLYVNPLLMGRTIAMSEKRPELKRMLVNVLMSQQHPAGLITPHFLRHILLGV